MYVYNTTVLSIKHPNLTLSLTLAYPQGNPLMTVFPNFPNIYLGQSYSLHYKDGNPLTEIPCGLSTDIHVDNDNFYICVHNVIN